MMRLDCLRKMAKLATTACRARLLHCSPRSWEAHAAVQRDTATETPRAVFRTSQTDPANHQQLHEGLHYTIPPSDLKSTFPHGLPRHFQLQVKTFGEACLMVRQPALELISYLKATNFSYPAVRYLIYGERGCGKTLTLCNAVHYCSKQDWLILHVPDAYIWVKSRKELLQSAYNPARFDQPIEASVWLKNFKITNERFLKEIKTRQKYIWSKREATEEGRPLGEVVEQGLTRVKSASDAVGVLFKELKGQSSPDTYRLLVANALWGLTTMRKEDSSQEGFDTLNPFVPIEVRNYSEKEFESCYQYYVERKWIQHEKAHTEEGKQELLSWFNYSPGIMDGVRSFLRALEQKEPVHLQHSLFLSCREE